MSILEGSYNRYLFQGPRFFADLRHIGFEPDALSRLTGNTLHCHLLRWREERRHQGAYSFPVVSPMSRRHGSTETAPFRWGQ